MGSKPDWWVEVILEFLRDRKVGKVTLNCKGDGVVASIDLGEHMAPTTRSSVGRVYVYHPSACGVTLDRIVR